MNYELGYFDFEGRFKTLKPLESVDRKLDTIIAEAQHHLTHAMPHEMKPPGQLAVARHDDGQFQIVAIEEQYGTTRVRCELQTVVDDESVPVTRSASTANGRFSL